MVGQYIEKRRIWVVDDDIRATHVLARMLREDGHDVDVIHDGAQALAQLRTTKPPDILVTDVQMPHADGFAVAAYARLQQPQLPIFFVTGYPDWVSRRIKSLSPAPQVFVKPLDYEALSMELANVLVDVHEALCCKS